MAKGKKHTDIVEVLKQFRDDLLAYYQLLDKADRNEVWNKEEEKAANQLFDSIGLNAGYHGWLITDLTNESTIDFGNKPYNMWSMTLRIPVDRIARNATGFCIQVLNRALGRLLKDISSGKRDKYTGKLITKKGREIQLESSIQLFDAMHLHPEIIEASRKLFKDGHYRDAIYRSFVALNQLVKDKSGLSPNELRGMKDSQLMARVFDINNPIIKLNNLITDTEISEQEGFKFLFMGATIGIRNPKAHENIIQNDPHRTLEYLSFASLLFHTISFWEVDTKNTPKIP